MRLLGQIHILKSNKRVALSAGDQWCIHGVDLEQLARNKLQQMDFPVKST